MNPVGCEESVRSPPAWVAPHQLALLGLASAQLRAWAADLDRELRTGFEAMAASTGAAATTGAAPYLLPVSQPVVLLPLWLAGCLPDPTVVDLLGSALAGYLAVRVQDDWCDRATGDAGQALLLSAALAARHAALVGRHPVGADYWDLHEQRWARYATAMAFERRVATGKNPYGEAEFQRVLDRSRPVVLPGAAALALCGRWPDLPVLAALVDHLVAAHQRFDDLRDGLEDLRAGLCTLVLAQSEARTAGQWLAFLAAGGADAQIAIADAELREAAACARRLGLAEAQLWIAARQAAMSAWQAQWRGGPLAALLVAEKPA